MTNVVTPDRFRQRSKQPTRCQLTHQQFDALRQVSSHDWLIGGPWEALEPLAVALYAISLLDGKPGMEAVQERWRKVLYDSGLMEAPADD
jgi:hypothetical protein